MAGESARPIVALDTQEHPLAYQSVEDYLRTDASVDIQQRAPSGVLSDISVRGGSFEQTMVTSAPDQCRKLGVRAEHSAVANPWYDNDLVCGLQNGARTCRQSAWSSA